MNIAAELTVSDAVAIFNQILDTATPEIVVTGEIANLKVSRGKWVFFDIKDESCSLGCFMLDYQLRGLPIEDGMKVLIKAKPNITKWGKFSLTVRAIKPVGAGAIKKSFEALKKKLTDEGLFDLKRKRLLPTIPRHIGVISSIDAAGYKDFIKIVSARMGGLKIDVISTQVQGIDAPDQIIAAIRQFNEMANPPEVLAILRGGGSRDDLAAFDDELLVRAISVSRIPTIVGVGHEIDVTLADLVADVRASTPSNAAELLVPDRREIMADVNESLSNMVYALSKRVDNYHRELTTVTTSLTHAVDSYMTRLTHRLATLAQTLTAYNPRDVLRRGYAIVWNDQRRLATNYQTGDRVTIETDSNLITAEVKDVANK